MNRKTLVNFDAVHAAIFARIVQGHYRPSRRIGVAELAVTLGVSTTPVREALRHLAGRDVVVERHREGFYLAPLSARAIGSLYAAHGAAVDLTLVSMTARPPTKGPSRNLWRLFEASATMTSDFALIAVRRYLDDRLAVLRRPESTLLGDLSDRAVHFGRALAARDADSARAMARAFHEACASQAERLAIAFDPHP
jgi:DNA-binding GntR family transcriptional regulator